MARYLEDLPQNGRVVVVRLRSLGDCVLTTPALQLLKGARPDLRVAVVVEDRFRPVFEGNPDIETLLGPGTGAVRGFAPHLCLNLHGGGTSAKLTALSGARWRAGFAHFRYSFLYNIRIPRAQEILDLERKVHTAEHLASAVFYLGVPPSGIPRARLFADGTPGGEPYAVIHPMASERSKMWSEESFLAIAGHLKHSLGVEPVFIAGPGENLSAFREYRIVCGAPLGKVKSLLKGAVLFLGNDSGPAHMAAAFGIPTVVIFGSSDQMIWRPWKTPSEVLTNPAGIGFVRVEEVRGALERLRVHA